MRSPPDWAAPSTLGGTVNPPLYRDGGHAVHFDSPDLTAWVGKLTGHSA